MLLSTMPPIHDCRTEPLRVTQSTVFEGLKMTSLGLSSTLYPWDNLRQKFMIANVTPGTTVDLLIDEKDNVLSSRSINRIHVTNFF